MNEEVPANIACDPKLSEVSEAQSDGPANPWSLEPRESGLTGERRATRTEQQPRSTTQQQAKQSPRQDSSRSRPGTHPRPSAMQTQREKGQLHRVEDSIACLARPVR